MCDFCQVRRIDTAEQFSLPWMEDKAWHLLLGMTLKTRAPENFSFYLSCDINLQVFISILPLSWLQPKSTSKIHLLCLCEDWQWACNYSKISWVTVLTIFGQVKVRIDKLLGKFGVLNKNDDGSARPSALYASGDLCASNKKLGLTSRTPFAESDGNGASWGAPLLFPIKVGGNFAYSICRLQAKLEVWVRQKHYTGGHAVQLGTLCLWCSKCCSISFSPHHLSKRMQAVSFNFGSCLWVRLAFAGQCRDIVISAS